MLKDGMVFKINKIVSAEDTAKVAGSGNLEVFSTPHMIALMEKTAYNCVQNYLNEGDTTVGTEVNIKHLKATPVGKEVVCEAKLIKIDGRKLDFEVVVYEGNDKIGEGYHSRFIVNVERFLAKLK